MLTVDALESRNLLSGNGLDPSFGTGGQITTDFGGSDVAAEVLVQPNGKIIAVGTSSTAHGVSSFALARYNSDGTLDSTFGTGGMVTGPPGALATGAALDASGDIVVAGQNLTSQFIVARYTASGVLDSTFGTAGVVTTPVANATNASVAIQPTDGKIVVGGYSAGGPPTSFSTIDVIRYNTNGSLDTTFGTAGIANAGNGKIINQVFIQSDGKIVVAGNDEPGMTVTNTAFFVKRLNSNGSVDNTVQPFVDVGIANAANGLAGNVAVGLALQSDGKFLELGTSNGNPILVRLNSDGTPDTSFGVKGQVATEFAGRSSRLLPVSVNAGRG
jgi:uncharacterized delta-60 repeat protein